MDSDVAQSVFGFTCKRSSRRRLAVRKLKWPRDHKETKLRLITMITALWWAMERALVKFSSGRFE